MLQNLSSAAVVIGALRVLAETFCFTGPLFRQPKDFPGNFYQSNVAMFVLHNFSML